MSDSPPLAKSVSHTDLQPTLSSHTVPPSPSHSPSLHSTPMSNSLSTQSAQSAQSTSSTSTAATTVSTGRSRKRSLTAELATGFNDDVIEGEGKRTRRSQKVVKMDGIGEDVDDEAFERMLLKPGVERASSDVGSEEEGSKIVSRSGSGSGSSGSDESEEELASDGGEYRVHRARPRALRHPRKLLRPKAPSSLSPSRSTDPDRTAIGSYDRPYTPSDFFWYDKTATLLPVSSSLFLSQSTIGPLPSGLPPKGVNPHKYELLNLPHVGKSEGVTIGNGYKGDVRPDNKVREHEFIRNQRCVKGCTFHWADKVKPIRLREHLVRCRERKKFFQDKGERDHLGRLCELQCIAKRHGAQQTSVDAMGDELVPESAAGPRSGKTSRLVTSTRGERDHSPPVSFASLAPSQGRHQVVKSQPLFNTRPLVTSTAKFYSLPRSPPPAWPKEVRTAAPPLPLTLGYPQSISSDHWVNELVPPPELDVKPLAFPRSPPDTPKSMMYPRYSGPPPYAVVTPYTPHPRPPPEPEYSFPPLVKFKPDASSPYNLGDYCCSLCRKPLASGLSPTSRIVFNEHVRRHLGKCPNMTLEKRDVWEKRWLAGYDLGDSQIFKASVLDAAVEEDEEESEDQAPGKKRVMNLRSKKKNRKHVEVDEDEETNSPPNFEITIEGDPTLYPLPSVVLDSHSLPAPIRPKCISHYSRDGTPMTCFLFRIPAHIVTKHGMVNVSLYSENIRVPAEANILVEGSHLRLVVRDSEISWKLGDSFDDLAAV